MNIIVFDALNVLGEIKFMRSLLIKFVLFVAIVSLALTGVIC